MDLTEKKLSSKKSLSTSFVWAKSCALWPEVGVPPWHCHAPNGQLMALKLAGVVGFLLEVQLNLSSQTIDWSTHSCPSLETLNVTLRLTMCWPFMVCAPALFLGLWRTSFRPQVLLPLCRERQAYFRWPGTKACRSAIATKWGRSQTAGTAGYKWRDFLSSGPNDMAQVQSPSQNRMDSFFIKPIPGLNQMTRPT